MVCTLKEKKSVVKEFYYWTLSKTCAIIIEKIKSRTKVLKYSPNDGDRDRLMSIKRLDCPLIMLHICSTYHTLII